MSDEEMGGRRLDDFQLGRVIARQEELFSKLEELQGELKEHRETEEGKWQEVKERLDAHKYVWNTVKTVGLITIAVLTFKFGEIGKYISYLFK